MKRYQLYHGDCLEIMPTLEVGSVDLTVTSPPYDNLREYGESFSPDAFDWKAIIKELYWLTKPGGVVVWVVADETIDGCETLTSFKQALYAKNTGFSVETMIYKTDKPPMNHRRYQACFEYMFVFSKGAPNTFNPIMVGSKKADIMRQAITYWNANGTKKEQWRGGRVSPTKIKDSIWYYASGNNGDNPISMKHPARFPEALARDHILSWSNPGDTVFDPMMGSGTTGAMAIPLKRNFIGIELEREYYDIAAARIANAADDYRPAPKDPEGQRALFWDTE